MAILYDVTASSILADPTGRFQKLKTDAERIAQNELAELLLGLYPPAYTGDDAAALTVAVAIQVAFQLEQGFTPEIVKSQTRSHPGDTTGYRDRYIHAGAAAIVARVTRTATVGFSPTPRGV
jgi:hypothetical protein